MNRAEQRFVFKSLVTNAKDFLIQSIHGLEDQPKFSVINFCTAVELLLKARLVLEHWSLIYHDPRTADLSKFKDGDFKSVTVGDTIDRLNRIANAGVPPQAAECFRKLQNHRNRLVHFVHPAYSSPAVRRTLEGVISEQLRAWYHLSQLLRHKWREEFSVVASLMQELDGMMHLRSNFLRVKFAELTEVLKAHRVEGTKILPCPSCEFEAAVLEFELGPVLRSTCLVCEQKVGHIHAKCPSCEHANLLAGGGGYVCTSCGKQIAIDSLMAEHAEAFASKGDQIEQGYCDLCTYTKFATVVLIGETYVCLYCLWPHSAIGYCAWCGESVTGEVGDPFQPGCVMCAYHIQKECEELELLEEAPNPGLAADA
jgi:hypothetical protein